MAERVNPALIGGFVVGAILLGVAGLLMFGGGKFFRETSEGVLFFSSSVNGLVNGSPVTFQGVRIGVVKSVGIMADPETFSFLVPVIIEIERGNLDIVRDQTVAAGTLGADPGEVLRRLIDKGLRAQLRTRSMVTGQLEVALSFHPDAPANYLDPIGGRLEIPTVPSSMEALTKSLQELPIEALMQSMLATIENIQKLVSTPEFATLAGSVEETLKEVRVTLASARKSVEGAEIEMRELRQELSAQTGPLAEELTETARSTRAFLLQAEKTLAEVASAVDEESKVRRNFTEALDDVGDAAQAVKALADYVERHPESFLRGKGGE